MSKEEYANEIKKLAYHYNKGKEDERKRILKLIEEIYQTADMQYNNDDVSWGIDKFYDKIKEELRK